MMIQLEFQVDDRVLEEDIQTDPAAANPAALQETYFEMLVRLSIDGMEMLEADGITTSPWLPLPLLDVGRTLPELLDNLGDGSMATYWLPGSGWSLRMKRAGSEVELESTINNRHTIVPYSELRTAALMFRERVRSLMRDRVPQLQSHQVWGPWIEGNSC